MPQSPARRLALLAAVAGLLAAAPAGAAAPGFLGVYGDDLPGTPDRAAAVAEAQRQNGIGVVRLPFIWSRIELKPGLMTFTNQDIAVGAAARAGIDVLPFIIDAPVFRALDTPYGHVRRPSDPADLGAFATVLVHRYGPGGSFWAEHPELPARPIRAWQVWNEPNLVHNWYPAPDPVGYTELLRATATALRTADPAAEVLAGGMPDSDNGMPFEEYVAGLYAAGAQRWFDAFSLNAYSPSAQGTVDLVRYVRGLLSAHGDDRPFDVTEFGWASSGPVKPQTTTEAGQAENVAAVVRALVAEREQLKLERLVYFSWRDRPLQPPSHDQWPYHTGLLRTDDSAKPALVAFRDAGAAVGITPGSPGAAEPDPAGPAAAPHGRGRGRVDHRPAVKILGRTRRSLASVIARGWRVRLHCRARCMVRLRLVVTGHATASHARIALSRAGTRTLRLGMSGSVGRRIAKRRRVAMALEVADVARTPLHVVTRIRLVAVA